MSKIKFSKVEKSVIKKSPALYIVLIVLWALLAGLFWYLISKSFGNIPYLPDAHITDSVNVFANILLALNSVFISYFWLNGIKDFVYVVWYFVQKKDC